MLGCDPSEGVRSTLRFSSVFADDRRRPEDGDRLGEAPSPLSVLGRGLSELRRFEPVEFRAEPRRWPVLLLILLDPGLPMGFSELLSNPRRLLPRPALTRSARVLGDASLPEGEASLPGLVSEDKCHFPSVAAVATGLRGLNGARAMPLVILAFPEVDRNTRRPSLLWALTGLVKAQSGHRGGSWTAGSMAKVRVRSMLTEAPPSMVSFVCLVLAELKEASFLMIDRRFGRTCEESDGETKGLVTARGDEKGDFVKVELVVVVEVC